MPEGVRDLAPDLEQRAERARRGGGVVRALGGRAGLVGLVFLLSMAAACLVTLPWTLRVVDGTPRYNRQERSAALLPPWWWSHSDREREQLDRTAALRAVAPAARAARVTPEAWLGANPAPGADELVRHRPRFWLGTDALGRDLLVRCLAGGGVSLGIGMAAAAISLAIGTLYGALAGYAGGRVDAVMMRIVDVLYGLPYLLLVVLLAVASEAVLDEYVTRNKARTAWIEQRAALVAAEAGAGTDVRAVRALLERDVELRRRLQAEAEAEPGLAPRSISAGQRSAYDVVTLLVAIGGVSWLTMARVIRGQVLSLKSQPFMEAARAMGVPLWRQFARHLLPNLVGPIVVYATLTVPQAILQESFLSFLGIGVKAPLPSWGNLAADGLNEINPVKSRWWMLAAPCVLLACTLLALNFLGEGLAGALDPRRRKR